MLSTRTCGLKTRTRPIPTRTTWVARSAIARIRFSFADSSVPRMLSAARATISDRAADDVAGAVPEPGPEDGQVVGHEEGRDRDRDRVVEHLAPGGDEADQLVEGVAGEAGGAAGLRVHHGRLGVGGGGGGEDQPGDDEGDRGQAEGEGGGDAERVVDRGADVAVGGGEQGADAVDAAQRFVSGDSLGHLELPERTPTEYTDAAGPPHVGRVRARPARRSRRAPAPAPARRAAAPAPAPRPASPPAARPQRAGRPTSTASAPSASAIATSIAAADAAVDEHRAAPGDRLDDLGQRVGGGRDAVELAPAVVGDDDARRPRARPRAPRPRRSARP